MRRDGLQGFTDGFKIDKVSFQIYLYFVITFALTLLFSLNLHSSFIIIELTAVGNYSLVVNLGHVILLGWSFLTFIPDN